MSRAKWLLAILAAVVGILGAAGDLGAQRPEKAPKPSYVPPPESFGYRPPPVDLKGLAPSRDLFGEMAPPASWDWRALGGVTSVKNQNPYGTCWAFAGLGDLESKALILESKTYDFSEVNVVACNPTGTTCNSGGHAWTTTNYLSLLGTVSESCNPYPGGCPTPSCVNPACPYGKRVTEWRVIPNDVLAIKNAVMTYGPVYTAMYASFPGFSTYNGTYCLTYAGAENPNHAVLIVGWDDAMCGGAGAWIVKNSWGTAWGASGYFYIKYGNARIGTDSSVYTGFKLYNANERIYYWDDWGWWSSVGWGDGEDYGMVVFTPTNTPPEGHLLRAVDFWAVWAPTNYTIEIWDNFSGSNFSNLLAGPFTGTKTEAGYYSHALPTPITVYEGNTIYVKMRFNTPGYGYPIPCDDEGPMETNKSYVSNNGSTWSPLDLGNYAFGDIGIRARVEPKPASTQCSIEGDPALRYGWGELDGRPYNQPGRDFASLYPGQSTTYRLGPYNAHATWLPAGCKVRDTLCCHVSDSKGWTIGGNPPLGTAMVLDPGYLWYQDVTITAPCSAAIGERDTVVARVGYTDVNGVCAPSCQDCNDPNVRPTTGVLYYSADTLVVTIVAPPPSLAVFQDTLTLVERGQTQAYVPFAICNQDDCAPPTGYNYVIRSKGHVGSPLNTSGTVTVAGGDCEDVYGVLDAGAAVSCTWDTLWIVVSTVAEPIVSDTCYQVVHVIEPEPVPVMSTTGVVILVAVLIAVAALFMLRRMKSKP